MMIRSNHNFQVHSKNYLFELPIIQPTQATIERSKWDPATTTARQKGMLHLQQRTMSVSSQHIAQF